MLYICILLNCPGKVQGHVTGISGERIKGRTFSISLSLALLVPRAGTDEVLSSLPLPEPISDERFFFDLELKASFDDFGGF